LKPSLRASRMIALFLVAAPLVPAANVSFSGTFTSDLQVQFFTFTVATDTAGVGFGTLGYAGGTNANGQTVEEGGFDPHLDLWDPSGNPMNPGTFSCVTTNPVTLYNPAPDSVTGTCGDTYYPTTLSFPGGVWAAGTYTVALEVDGNPATGATTDPFLIAQLYGQSSTPLPANFSCIIGAPGYQPAGGTIDQTAPFCDEYSPTGAQRTGGWAIDFVNVTSASEVASTPEPGTLGLALLAGAVLAARRIRERA